MKTSFLLGLILALCAGSGYAVEGDFVKFQKILDDKCGQCHTRGRIEDSMRQGENLDEILQKMIRFGARISEQEQQVLGVFWRSGEKTAPATLPSGSTVSEDPLGEFRAVLENRCTGCHNLDRVEEAMMQGRSIDDLVEMMRKRGAVVSEADKDVLGTFWGDPLKDKAE